MQKKWIIKHQISDNATNRQQAIIDILLISRGLTTKSKQGEFFDDSNPHDLTPKQLGIDTKQLKLALNRLQKARTNNEKILIYGDYDTDGVTSTAILWETLNSLGFEVMPFLPHREKHGYGIKPSSLEDAIKEHGKPKLIITVDNGIVAFEGAQFCKDQEIDLIICDHHEPIPGSNKFPENTSKQQFPDCLAVVHTTQTAGAGVAYLFAKEILTYFQTSSVVVENLRPLLDQLVELATIGIIADLVPLIGPSRQVVKHGLQLLPKTTRPGLRALMADAGIKTDQPMQAYHIGFVLAPRLNASGRLEHSIDSLRLLCTRKQEKAIELAFHLGQTNKQRQGLTNDNLQPIIESIQQQTPTPKILVTTSNLYNPGVIGLIAGKLTEYFARPSIAIAIMDGFAKGSVRSVPGINIIEILRVFEGEFLELGGHPMAAGFSVATDNIESLTKKLQAYARENIDEKMLVPTLETEAELNPTDISIDLYKEIEKFAPFGMGNQKPVFITRGLHVASVMPMGKQRQHVKLLLKTEEKIIEALQFNAQESIFELKLNDTVDIAYQIDLNEWNGKKKVQLLIKDISYPSKC
jgi:single-stranded-DNA-specific exonuclease